MIGQLLPLLGCRWILPFRATSGRLLCAALSFVLVGCAGLGVSPGQLPSRDTLGAFELEGRFSLRQGEQNFSGRLSWRHLAGENVVLLSSPFGQGLAEIVTDGLGARLKTSEGKTYAAADGESLTARVLGYPLPITGLADWLRARGGESGQRDVHGRLVRLDAAGWRIDYAYDVDAPDVPPSRLVVSGQAGGDPTELRLRIDRWTPLSHTEYLPSGKTP